jgi:hypothetical protein
MRNGSSSAERHTDVLDGASLRPDGRDAVRARLDHGEPAVDVLVGSKVGRS